MRRIVFLAFLVGCGGASTTPAKSRPAPTETDACERMCEVYEGCRIVPTNCAAVCAADQKRLRDGVQPALVGCLERELAGCEHRELTERRQIVSLCFAAVLEAYAKDATAMNRIARAVCARQAKCAPSPDAECETKIRAQYKDSPNSKVLAIVRPELLEKTASCIESASCDDNDPVQSCQ